MLIEYTTCGCFELASFGSVKETCLADVDVEVLIGRLGGRAVEDVDLTIVGVFCRACWSLLAK